MPYRRLPATDAARLKAIKTVMDNSSLYTVSGRIVDWSVLNRLPTAFTRLDNARKQYKAQLEVQRKATMGLDPLLRRATMYVCHFLHVLFLAVERGEVKTSRLELYGLPPSGYSVPKFHTAESLISFGRQLVAGEKQRIKLGGLPIYNPSIGKVATQLAVFADAYEEQQLRIRQTQEALEALQRLRPDTDELLLELWNQIEKHFADAPPEVRFAECRKLGVVYYYRRHEEHLY